MYIIIFMYYVYYVYLRTYYVFHFKSVWAAKDIADQIRTFVRIIAHYCPKS